VSEPHPLITELKKTRKRANIPVAALARRLGYTEAAIRSWEAGRSTPTTDTLTDYADALGMRVVLIPKGKKP
jgi:transcriptional regulator with XRE-family HTH domain